MLDNIKKSFASAKNSLSSEVSKFKNKNFMIAVVSSCAMTAAADGNISPEEKQKMIRFIEAAPELKAFDTKDVIKEFKEIAESFEFDGDVGKALAFKNIAKIKGNSDQCRLLIRVCISIANSDGDFDKAEKDVISEIATELNLDPSDFI